MPDTHLILRLKIKLSTMDPAAFEPLWRALGQPPFQVEKYNDIEPVRLRYDPEGHRAAWAHWILRGGGLLFMRGKSYLGSLDDGPAGVAHFHMELPVATAEVATAAAQLVAWTLALEPAFEILFGCVCTKEEFDCKHRDENGNAHGYSHWTFLEYFQGLYWFTYLGREAVPHLPSGLPGTWKDWQIEQTAGGGLGIQLQETVLPNGLGRRLEAERELAALLGESWFFVRFQGKEADYHHPPGYFAYLEALQDDLDALQQRFAGEFEG